MNDPISDWYNISIWLKLSVLPGSAAQSCNNWEDCVPHLAWGSAGPGSVVEEDFMAQTDISIVANDGLCTRRDTDIENRDCSETNYYICQFPCEPGESYGKAAVLLRYFYT